MATAREKFTVGDRIQQAADCPRTIRDERHGRFKQGVVVGFGRAEHLVRVHFDGESPRTTHNYPVDFIEVVR